MVVVSQNNVASPRSTRTTHGTVAASVSMDEIQGPCFADLLLSPSPSSASAAISATITQRRHFRLFFNYLRLGQWELARSMLPQLSLKAPGLLRKALLALCVNPSHIKW